MVHTFEINTTIWSGPAQRMLEYLGAKDRFSGKVNINGIAKLSLYPRGEFKNGYLLKVEVNPAKLLNGFDAFETVPANQSVLDELSVAFKREIANATGEENLLDLSQWSVCRIDYAVDINTPYVEEYVKLLNKGDKPIVYDDKARGKTGSCYWSCKSTVINVYNKANQMTKRGKSPELVKRAQNILRFEVQCSSPKVGYIRKNREFESRELHYFFCTELAESVLMSYCRRVYKTGDYYTFRTAQARMESLGASKRRISACNNIIRAIAQTRSISEARKQLFEDGLILKNINPLVELRYSKEQFSRNCSLLADMDINPVTIPREWKIDSLQGVFRLLEHAFMSNTDITMAR